METGLYQKRSRSVHTEIGSLDRRHLAGQTDHCRAIPTHGPTGGIMTSANGEKIFDIPIRNDTIGAYLIVEANGYEEAVALTKGCPVFENA